MTLSGKRTFQNLLDLYASSSERLPSLLGVWAQTSGRHHPVVLPQASTGPWPLWTGALRDVLSLGWMVQVLSEQVLTG